MNDSNLHRKQLASTGHALSGVALLLLLPLLACACASMAEREARLPLPPSANEAHDARFRAGRGLYVRSCAKCHDLYEPSEFSETEWPAYVKRYGPRAGLNSDERKIVTEYLIAAAQR